VTFEGKFTTTSAGQGRRGLQEALVLEMVENVDDGSFNVAA